MYEIAKKLVDGKPARFDPTVIDALGKVQIKNEEDKLGSEESINIFKVLPLMVLLLCFK